MLSSNCLPLSTTYSTARTSRPPVRVSVSLRGTSMPPLTTRSTFPMVTTSPSLRIAEPTRVPLTNGPLLLRSWISVPNGVSTNVAWWREASTSGTTMSLSSARPMLTEPAIFGGGDARCDKNFTNLVARLDTSPDRAPTTVISAGATISGRGVRPALTTVMSADGGLGGGGGKCTSVGWARVGCRGAVAAQGGPPWPRLVAGRRPGPVDANGTAVRAGEASTTKRWTAQ